MPAHVIAVFAVQMKLQVLTFFVCGLTAIPVRTTKNPLECEIKPKDVLIGI